MMSEMVAKLSIAGEDVTVQVQGNAPSQPLKYRPDTVFYAEFLTQQEQRTAQAIVETDYYPGAVLFSVHVTTPQGQRSHRFQLVKCDFQRGQYTLSVKGTYFDVELLPSKHGKYVQYMPKQVKLDTSKVILSPMPGAVRAVTVQVGDTVAPGQQVAVIEAMKMQNALRATGPGKVKAVHIKPGQTVSSDELLVELE